MMKFGVLDDMLAKKKQHYGIYSFNKKTNNNKMLYIGNLSEKTVLTRIFSIPSTPKYITSWNECYQNFSTSM